MHHQLLALAGCCCGPACGWVDELGMREWEDAVPLARLSDCVVSCSQHGYRWQSLAHLCAGIESISLAVCDLLSAAAAAAADVFPAAAGAPRPAPAASRGLKPCSPLYSSLICTPGARSCCSVTQCRTQRQGTRISVNRARCRAGSPCRGSHLAGYLGLLCLLIQRHLLPMVAHEQVVCALEGQQRQSLDSLALNRQLACACGGGRGSMRGRSQSAVCRLRRRLAACPEDAGHRCGSSWQHCPSCLRQLAWRRPGGGAAGSAGGAAAAMVQRCCS